MDGAYCPNCDCELEERKKEIWFGWKVKYIWECPSCGLEQERPKDYLFEEEEAIQKITMREYEHKKREGKI